MKHPLIARTLFAASIIALGQFAGAATATAQSAAPATDLDRKAIEKIVRDYLLSNPEVLLEAQNALEQKQREQQQIAQKQVIQEAGDAIFNSQYDGVAGNPDGKITVVEFFDYNCGFCKRALSDMEAIVKENDDVRFVLKEFPILGEDSHDAHVVSMAVRAIAPEKYEEFHTALLGNNGRANGDVAMKTALDLGIDETALRAEMENPEIPEIFAGTYDLANQLSVTGTPAYVIGGELLFGAQGKDAMLELIDAARACSDDAANCS